MSSTSSISIRLRVPSVCGNQIVVRKFVSPCTTCAFVMAYPSGLIMTPEPSPAGVETLMTAAPMILACSRGESSGRLSAVEKSESSVRLICETPSAFCTSATSVISKTRTSGPTSSQTRRSLRLTTSPSMRRPLLRMTTSAGFCDLTSSATNAKAEQNTRAERVIEIGLDIVWVSFGRGVTITCLTSKNIYANYFFILCDLAFRIRAPLGHKHCLFAIASTKWQPNFGSLWIRWRRCDQG